MNADNADQNLICVHPRFICGSFSELASHRAVRIFLVVDIHVVVSGVLDDVHDLFAPERGAVFRKTVRRGREHHDWRTSLVRAAFMYASCGGSSDLIDRTLITNLP